MDPHDDPAYHAYLADAAAACCCCPDCGLVPCEGVLAGGVCDDLCICPEDGDFGDDWDDWDEACFGDDWDDASRWGWAGASPRGTLGSMATYEPFADTIIARIQPVEVDDGGSPDDAMRNAKEAFGFFGELLARNNTRATAAHKVIVEAVRNDDEIWELEEEIGKKRTEEDGRTCYPTLAQLKRRLADAVAHQVRVGDVLVVEAHRVAAMPDDEQLVAFDRHAIIARVRP
jgi:hypothetical protein